jgi:hypothetical protein
MEKYIDYKNSRFDVVDINKDFKKVSETSNEILLKISLGSFDFEMYGFISNGIFCVSRKRFLNQEGEVETYPANILKPYGEIFYLPNGQPELLMNYTNGQLDSTNTFAPSYEIFTDKGTDKLWYIKGNNKTHLVRNFCRENEINENEMSQDDVELILMNIAEPN